MSARALPAALLTLLLMAAACQPAAQSTATPTPSPSDTPTAEATESAMAGSETIDIDDVEVDDCYNAPATNVETVEVVDCAQPHVYQAFALVDHPAGADDPFPGDQELTDYASAECRERFDAYVGIEYADSIYFINFFKPSESTWGAGDREVICNVKLEDDSEWTGSAKGSEE